MRWKGTCCARGSGHQGDDVQFLTNSESRAMRMARLPGSISDACKPTPHTRSSGAASGAGRRK
eukprot:5303747-Prymnesium_polylepis.1